MRRAFHGAGGNLAAGAAAPMSRGGVRAEAREPVWWQRSIHILQQTHQLTLLFRPPRAARYSSSDLAPSLPSNLPNPEKLRTGGSLNCFKTNEAWCAAPGRRARSHSRPYRGGDATLRGCPALTNIFPLSLFTVQHRAWGFDVQWCPLLHAECSCVFDGRICQHWVHLVRILSLAPCADRASAQQGVHRVAHIAQTLREWTMCGVFRCSATAQHLCHRLRPPSHRHHTRTHTGSATATFRARRFLRGAERSASQTAIRATKVNAAPLLAWRAPPAAVSLEGSLSAQRPEGAPLEYALQARTRARRKCLAPFSTTCAPLGSSSRGADTSGRAAPTARAAPY